MFWSSVPVVIPPTVSTIDNTAVYGPTLATPARRLVIADNSWSQQPQTGGSFFTGSITLRVVDEYSHIVVSDNSTEVTLTSTSTVFRSATALRGLRMFQGQLKLTSEFGILDDPGVVSVILQTTDDIQPTDALNVTLRDCRAGEGKQANSQVCQDCTPGRYSSNNGTDPCAPCLAGKLCAAVGVFAAC